MPKKQKKSSNSKQKGTKETSHLKEEISKVEDDPNFEIIDYTEASPWESFISVLEETFNEWKEYVLLSKNKSNSNEESEIKVDSKNCAILAKKNISFGNGPKFQLILIQQRENIPKINSNNDIPLYTKLFQNFPSDVVHPIRKWFGINYFLLLEPLDGKEVGPNESCLLMSSIVLALNHSHVEIPIFITIREEWKGTFMGCQKYKNGNTMKFEGDGLGDTPDEFLTISGLIDFFNTKLRENLIRPYGVNSPIEVTSRYTYTNSSELAQHWNELLEDYDFLWLPDEDPIEEMKLFLFWNFQEFNLNSLVDEFIPKDASLWFLKCTFSSNVDCIASELINRVIEVYLKSSKNDLLIHDVNSPPPIQVNSKPLFNAVGTISRSFYDIPKPEEVDQLLTLIWQPTSSPSNFEFNPEIKGAPINSLISQLIVQLLNFKSLKAISLIWSKFVKEIRWHWDKEIIIPKISYESIQINQSLIYQKLQMINYCIDFKLKRSSQTTKKEHSKPQKTKDLKNTKEEEEEEEKKEEVEDGWDVEFDIASEKSSDDSKNETKIRRLGVKSKLDDLFLSNDPTENIYEPITQDNGVLTEDLMKEQEYILSQLGDSEEAHKIKTKMQASLLSDMQAFKAANPNNSTLEDFVRWHSPRDWVPDDPQLGAKCIKGHLSSRMNQSNNLWRELWKEAKPLPVSEQIPLFDANTHGEKAIHFLENITESEFFEQMLFIALGVVHSRFNTFFEENSKFTVIKEALDQVSKILKMGNWLSEKETRKSLYKNLKDLEKLCLRLLALHARFSQYEDLISDLFSNSESIISIENEKEYILGLFVDTNNELRAPEKKEYLFKTVIPPDTTENRMYALIGNHEFRISLNRKSTIL